MRKAEDKHSRSSRAWGSKGMGAQKVETNFYKFLTLFNKIAKHPLHVRCMISVRTLGYAWLIGAPAVSTGSTTGVSQV